MSKCIRRIMKPTEESYIKCDKCGKEITETEYEMSGVSYGFPYGFGQRLMVRNRMEQTIYDPSGHIPEQTNIHDLCPKCYEKFLNWLDED